MKYEVTGHFKAAGKAKELSNGKSTRKFWVDIDKDSKYPTVNEFDLYGDRVDISGLKAGDEITVTFDIKGRSVEYKRDGHTKKSFFQNLNVIAVVNHSDQEFDAPVGDPDDDLPF